MYSVLAYQYLYNRSLWHDEAMLALNIVERTFAGLLQPLENYQAAPVLFLYIEKFITLIFGNSELALRLFPFICALLSLPLLYFVSVALTGNRVVALCAMILLGCTPGFIYYSSEVKQYSSDLFVTLLILYTAFSNAHLVTKNRTLLLSVAGTIAIFLSNISVIILFVVGMYYLHMSIKTKKVSSVHLLPAVVWLAAFAINYLLFIKDHPHAAYMKAYWDHSFMPLDVTRPKFRRFINRTVVHLFRDLLPSLPYGLLFLSSAALYAGGLLFIRRLKNRRLLFFCLAPVIIHLALSSLRMYPFDQRLILYQAPLYVLVITFCVVHVVQALAKDDLTRSILLAVALLALGFKTFQQYPKVHGDVREAIKCISNARSGYQSLYVFRGAGSATSYYMHTGVAKFEDMNIVWGTSRTSGIADYFKDLDKMQGEVWLLVSHMYPYNGNRDEEMAVVHTLQQRGKLLQRHDFSGSCVYLFNLN